MDLKEVKRIVAFARKAGLSRLALDGLSFEFSSDPLPPVKKPPAAETEPAGPKPDPGPTLDQINQFIYGQDEAEEHA